MNWIILTILASIFQGAASLVDKYVLENEIKDPRTAITLWGYWAFLLFGIYSLIADRLSFNPFAIIIGILVGIFYVVSFRLYYKAVPILEISRLIPTLTLVPVFTTVYATIFFHERFAPVVYLGILGIIIGVLITDFQKGQKRSHLSLGYLIAIMACLSFSLKNVLTKYSSFAIQSTGEVMLWIGIGTLIGALVIHLKNFKEINRQFKKREGIFHLSISTFFSVMAAKTYTWAITIGPVSLVSFLSQLQVPLLFFGACILDLLFPKALHEKLSKKIFIQKFLCIILIIIGSYFLMF